jgi:hypothetical protein
VLIDGARFECRARRLSDDGLSSFFTGNGQERHAAVASSDVISFLSPLLTEHISSPRIWWIPRESLTSLLRLII